MGIFDRFFKKKQQTTKQVLSFGRFSDNYKKSERYSAWDESIEHYEKKEYNQSFEKFLNFLQDPKVQNLSYSNTEGLLEFEFFQGSKKVIGHIDSKRFFAEAKIAKCSEMEIGLLRRLLEQNYELKYTSYALDDDNRLTMVYDSFTHDSSPYKNYYALKELATSADKQDDILIEEFESLESINTGHITEVSDQLKEAKFKFLSKGIEAAIKEINEGKLNIDQYPGGISYLLLDLVYKCDYLLKPEGQTMDIFEQIHKNYFLKDEKSAQYRNREMIKSLKKLQERSKEEFFKEIYDVKSTFGVTAPSSHEQIVSLIDGELGNMDWYRDNRHHKIAQAVPGYIVGYSFFNYAMPAIDKELFHLYYKVVEHEFMDELGQNENLVKSDKLNRSLIISMIKEILSKYRSIYPSLNPNYNVIDFNSKILFAKSYLMFVRNLNVKKLNV